MRSKRIIPALKVVDELPQWIIASDVAAYTPWSRTIWLKRQSFWKMGFYLIHEIGHHLIEVLRESPRIHRAYDNLWELAFKSRS